MSEIKKIIDEREALKKKKKTKTEEEQALVKGWELNNFLVQLT